MRNDVMAVKHIRDGKTELILCIRSINRIPFRQEIWFCIKGMCARRTLHAIAKERRRKIRRPFSLMIFHAASELDAAVFPIPVAFLRTLGFRILPRYAPMIRKRCCIIDIPSEFDARVAEVLVRIFITALRWPPVC